MSFDALIGQRVRVHYNLQRGDFAIGDPANNRVLGYAESVELRDVTFRVQEGMRQRTIRLGRRKVHAYAVGTLVALDVDGPEGSRVACYNPYRCGAFTDESGAEVWRAGHAVFCHDDTRGWVHVA